MGSRPRFAASMAGLLLCGLVTACEWDDDDPDEASCAAMVHGPGSPELTFSYVPAYGSFEDLEGAVEHVAPSQHAVAVYIRVYGGWWTKSYWAAPLTSIDCDGSWICDITTGGIDQLADQIAAFLLPIGISPPLMSGGSSLPAELYQVSIAFAIVDRPQPLAATRSTPIWLVPVLWPFLGALGVPDPK